MQLELAQALVDLVNEYEDSSCIWDEDEDEQCRLYEDYSGRGMYGETTAGITGTSMENLVKCVITAIQEQDDAFIELIQQLDTIRNLRTDSLGRSIIIY